MNKCNILIESKFNPNASDFDCDKFLQTSLSRCLEKINDPDNIGMDEEIENFYYKLKMLGRNVLNLIKLH